MKINEKLYDIIKWVALVAIPALAILVTSLGGAWGWNVEAIVKTIEAVGLFLAALIGVSGIAYWKEKEIVEKQEEK